MHWDGWHVACHMDHNSNQWCNAIYVLGISDWWAAKREPYPRSIFAWQHRAPRTQSARLSRSLLSLVSVATS